MAVIVAMGTFFTVFLTVYGLAVRGEVASPMDSRLGGLRYSRPKREISTEENPAFRQRVLAPLMQALALRVNRALPSSMTDRLQLALVQGGLKIRAGQFIVVVGILVGLVPVLSALYFVMLGASFKSTLMIYGALIAFGAVGPRFWLLGRIKRRQKEIWRSLPDAFDLITASVEAGLGIDAAFNRVIDKVKGPFAVELSRTMREITVGRSRKDAFLDMSDRTGVEELRSLVNAIVQAEAMGISIGNVIRVQTGVIRMKRRQRAEQQAYKAPIKMVFPLVFFIFPAILVIIGGPAVLQIMGSSLSGGGG